MWKTLKNSFDSPDSYVSLALGLAVVLVVGMIAYNYFKARSQSATSTENQTNQEKTQNGQESLTLPAQYVVKNGDTLWSIAEVYYKSGYNWVDIQKANNLGNPDMIDVAQKLTIPKATPIVPAGQISAAGAETTAAKKPYTVVQGDSLWNIALQTYGTGYKWTAIAQANNLANPDLIFAGNVL